VLLPRLLHEHNLTSNYRRCPYDLQGGERVWRCFELKVAGMIGPSTVAGLIATTSSSVSFEYFQAAFSASVFEIGYQRSFCLQIARSVQQSSSTGFFAGQLGFGIMEEIDDVMTTRVSPLLHSMPSTRSMCLLSMTIRTRSLSFLELLRSLRGR
jgi:hypothetical protein